MPANGVLQAMRFQQFLFLLQGSLRIEPCIRKPENEKNPTECWLRKRSAMKRYLMRVGDFRVHFNFKWKSESEVTQSGQTLYNLMDCSLSGSSVHGIFQARILEWVAISFSRRSSQSRDWTCIFTIEPPGKPHSMVNKGEKKVNKGQIRSMGLTDTNYCT